MKVHLLDSDEPLSAGVDRMALCGKPVSRAQFAFMWDEQAMGEQLSFKGVCHKCGDLELEKRYVYGIVEGKHEDATTGA